MDKIRIVLADQKGPVTRETERFLSEHGFDVRVCETGDDLRETLKVFIPDIILIDLLFSDLNALPLIKYIRADEDLMNANIRVLVMSRHSAKSNVRECFKAGAADYIVRPYEMDQLFTRLIFHMQKKRMIAEKRGEGLKGAELYLHLIGLILRESLVFRQPVDSLMNLLNMIAMNLRAVRCNLVECNPDRLKGVVWASHDDRSAHGIEIDLSKYPEILQVLGNEKTLVLDSLEENPVLAKVMSNVKTIQFDAMIVCPVWKEGKLFGVMAARMAKDRKQLSDYDIRLTRIVSQVVSLLLERTEDSFGVRELTSKAS